MGNASKIFIRKPEERRSRGRFTRRWKENFKVYFKETGSYIMKWVHLVQDMVKWWAVANTLMNF
jgi:hypothetical protein